MTGTEMAGLGYVNGLFLAGRLMEETFPRIRDEYLTPILIFFFGFVPGTVSGRVAYPDPHYFEKLDPDPHEIKMSHTDPHYSKFGSGSALK